MIHLLNTRQRNYCQSKATQLAGGRCSFLGFYAPRNGRSVRELQIIALDGEDLRSLPLSMRKTDLARLLAPVRSKQ